MLENLDKLTHEIYESTKRINDETNPGKTYDFETVRELVEPIINLINEAKEKKKYIYIQPISTWISPEKFEEKLKDGWYIYHSGLIELRNPEDWIEEIAQEILDKRKEMHTILREISLYTGINENELEILALKKLMIKEKARDDVK